MRILFLNNYNYLRGGTERVLFEEVRMLKGMGYGVATFSRANSNNEPSAYERYFPREINTERLSLSTKVFSTVKELIYSRTAREGLRKVIAEFKPDIAHAHNIYGRLSTSVLDELYQQGIPTVLTLHDFKLLCPSYLMLNHGAVCERCNGKKFYQAVLTRCHKDSYIASAIYATESYFSHGLKKYDSVSLFIVPSLFLLNKHLEFGLHPKKLVYIPNYVASSDVSPSCQVGEDFLYFGRISREKGIAILVEAYSKLQSHAALVVAGDGGDRRNMEKIVLDGQKRRIHFTGYLRAKPLEKAIDGARAVVIPSQCYENAPMSILEAFAHGKPVIGARIGGIPEMIDDGANGFLFEPGNVEDLRSKLELISSLPDSKIREMGMAAREKVEKEYNPDIHYERLMAVYEKAIKKN